MFKMLGEKEIKALVLKYLFERNIVDNSSIITSEMSLAGKVRRVDLAYIKDGRLVAIEVKSEKDSLFRLEGQLEEYRKYFDKVIVVVAAKFVTDTLDIAARDVEVWSISSGKIKIARRGRIIKSIEKSNYVDLMTRREISLLARLVGVKSDGVAMYDLKNEVLKNLHKTSRAKVKGILLNGINKRFGMASNRFLTRFRSLGHVKETDLSLLSPYSHISFSD